MYNIKQQITSVFATPIRMQKVPELAAINPRLKEIILSRETVRRQNVGSNIGGWQSDHDLMQWPPSMSAPPLVDFRVLRHPPQLVSTLESAKVTRR